MGLPQQPCADSQQLPPAVPAFPAHPPYLQPQPAARSPAPVNAEDASQQKPYLHSSNPCAPTPPAPAHSPAPVHSTDLAPSGTELYTRALSPPVLHTPAASLTAAAAALPCPAQDQ